MEIPKLSARDQRALRAIQDLSDDDLYAILGTNEPIYYQPNSTPEYLLVGLRFEKTKAAIARGKKKLRQISAASHNSICEHWESLKNQNSPIDQKTVIAIVSEAIKHFLSSNPSLPIAPAVVLVCRACSYSLDRLCRNKKLPPPVSST